MDGKALVTQAESKVVKQAKERASQIRSHVNKAVTLIKEAWEAEDWRTLGYADWHSYCDAEFGSLRLRGAERHEAVNLLRRAGMSVRAIASATGDSKSTVAREVAGVPDGTPAAPRSKGTDHKSYPATQPKREALPPSGPGDRVVPPEHAPEKKVTTGQPGAGEAAPAPVIDLEQVAKDFIREMDKVLIGMDDPLIKRLAVLAESDWDGPRPWYHAHVAGALGNLADRTRRWATEMGADNPECCHCPVHCP